MVVSLRSVFFFHGPCPPPSWCSEMRRLPVGNSLWNLWSEHVHDERRGRRRRTTRPREGQEIHHAIRDDGGDWEDQSGRRWSSENFGRFTKFPKRIQLQVTPPPPPLTGCWWIRGIQEDRTIIDRFRAWDDVFHGGSWWLLSEERSAKK